MRRNKEQRQEHVIATTTGLPAHHSPWNTNVNCPELSWQQSTCSNTRISTLNQTSTSL